jgi:hypothetical protein
MTDAYGENQLTSRELFSVIESHREALLNLSDGCYEPLLYVRNETLLEADAVGDEGIKRYGQTDVSIWNTFFGAVFSETKRSIGIVN